MRIQPDAFCLGINDKCKSCAPGLTNIDGQCFAENCVEGELTFFVNKLSYKCNACKPSYGINSKYTMFDTKVPEFSNGDYLTRCEKCSNIYGATKCLFSGPQSFAVSCKPRMTNDNGKCIWEQLEGCKHYIDEQRQQCYACETGYKLVGGLCELVPKPVKVFGQRNLDEDDCSMNIETEMNCDCDYLSFVNSFNECELCSS